MEIEYSVTVRKTLSGGYLVSVRNDRDNRVASIFPEASKGPSSVLEGVGEAMRRHYDSLQAVAL